MANTRDIRRRIKSVKNTSQITRAMQLVAASKMKRAQENALAGRPYAVLMTEILSKLGGRVSDIKHPFLEEREVEKRGILVVSSDKGLCGALNANVLRRIVEIKDEARFVAIGRKAAQFLSRTQRDLLAEFTISDRVLFSEVRLPVEFLINAYYEGRVDTVELLYPRYVNPLVQDPIICPLIPIENLSSVIDKLGYQLGEAPLAHDKREIHFEPEAEAILEELLPLFIKQEVYQTVLEAKASEHSARMVAMKSATDNANNLVDDLTLQYNKARQAAITQEILEISAATN